MVNGDHGFQTLLFMDARWSGTNANVDSRHCLAQSLSYTCSVCSQAAKNPPLALNAASCLHIKPA